MSKNTKHVGKMKNNAARIAIVYRTLPGEAHYCLIVPTENLPDIYHDALINLVESNAGQESYEFAEAMDRTQFPDGSRMLPALHATGRLIKVATGAIEMTPTTGYSLLLSELNQVIAEQRGVSVDDLSLKESLEDKVKETKKTETVTKVEELAQTSEPTAFDSPETEAKYYRSQADKMAKAAAEMRRKAEELVPTKKKV
jgi:alanyl-tRNA synthetase